MVLGLYLEVKIYLESEVKQHSRLSLSVAFNAHAHRFEETR